MLLVTGGAGYIGSHVVRSARDAGRDVVVIDDLSNGADAPRDVPFVMGDIRDCELVTRVLTTYRVTACIHLAGMITVAESHRYPERYYDCNVGGSLALLDAMRDRVDTFVFSSSAAVYGAPPATPVTEDTPVAPMSPYGMTKAAVEEALEKRARTDRVRWAALRYFNAAGAHPDGTLQERHRPETHLIPLAIDAARGAQPGLRITGTDYATRDGTCIRDYVHVCDLAEAHLAALALLERGVNVGPVNLGSGQGHSVMDVLATVEQVMGAEVPRSTSTRRRGDPAVLLADVRRAADVLGWRPTRTLDEIVEDAARSRHSPA